MNIEEFPEANVGGQNQGAMTHSHRPNAKTKNVSVFNRCAFAAQDRSGCLQADREHSSLRRSRRGDLPTRRRHTAAARQVMVFGDVYVQPLLGDDWTLTHDALKTPTAEHMQYLQHCGSFPDVSNVNRHDSSVIRSSDPSI